MSRSFHCLWFNHPNNTRWKEQVKKFLIIYLSSELCYLIFIKYKYSPKNFVLKRSQTVRKTKFHTLSTNKQIKLQFSVLIPFDFCIEDGKIKNSEL
jgi:hypothetical protein